VRSCEILQTLNVDPLSRAERSELRWFGHAIRILQERLYFFYTLRKAAQRTTKNRVMWLILRPVLVAPWCRACWTIRDWWKPLEVWRFAAGLLLSRTLRKNAGLENETMKYCRSWVQIFLWMLARRKILVVQAYKLCHHIALQIIN